MNPIPQPRPDPRPIPVGLWAVIVILCWAVALTLVLIAQARADEPPMPAPTVIGAHLVSVHLRPAADVPGSLGWNDRTVGLYAVWRSGLTLGAVRNSLYRNSVYGGWTWSYGAAGRFGLTAALASGYDRHIKDLAPGEAAPGGARETVRCNSARCRRVAVRDTMALVLAPSVRLPIDERTSARLSLLADLRRDGSPALHLSIERAW